MAEPPALFAPLVRVGSGVLPRKPAGGGGWLLAMGSCRANVWGLRLVVVSIDVHAAFDRLLSRHDAEQLRARGATLGHGSPSTKGEGRVVSGAWNTGTTPSPEHWNHTIAGPMQADHDEGGVALAWQRPGVWSFPGGHCWSGRKRKASSCTYSQSQCGLQDHARATTPLKCRGEPRFCVREMPKQGQQPATQHYATISPVSRSNAFRYQLRAVKPALAPCASTLPMQHGLRCLVVRTTCPKSETHAAQKTTPWSVGLEAHGQASRVHRARLVSALVVQATRYAGPM